MENNKARSDRCQQGNGGIQTMEYEQAAAESKNHRQSKTAKGEVIALGELKEEGDKDPVHDAYQWLWRQFRHAGDWIVDCKILDNIGFDQGFGRSPEDAPCVADHGHDHRRDDVLFFFDQRANDLASDGNQEKEENRTEHPPFFRLWQQEGERDMKKDGESDECVGSLWIVYSVT